MPSRYACPFVKVGYLQVAHPLYTLCAPLLRLTALTGLTRTSSVSSVAVCFFGRPRQALKTETENEVKFNNSYQALYRQLKDVYTKIGATDFFGVVGEKFVYSRHEKVRCTKTQRGVW